MKFHTKIDLHKIELIFLKYRNISGMRYKPKVTKDFVVNGKFFIQVTGIITLLILSTFISYSKTDYFPQTKGFSQDIVSFDYYNSVTQDVRLAAVSLQGLVNRYGAKIYMYDNWPWIIDMYKSKNLIVKDSLYTNIYDLLKDFRSHYKGLVVYDPARRFTINLASNIAGVQDRVIISPSMLPEFLNRVDAEINVLDLTNDQPYKSFKTRLESYTWYETNILPLQIETVLAEAKDHLMHDVYRDYLIEFKVPTFWLPGRTDADYDLAYEQKIINLFKSTPANVPVLGFWPGLNYANENVGFEEYAGVKLAGRYGKFTVVNTWVGNYSFHSGVSDSSFIAYQQTKVREKTPRKYDPNKKYVALIMIESGDSPAYLQFAFNDYQWGDPLRGQVPMSIGLNMSTRLLMPGLAQYLFESATSNEFFFSPVSGIGYNYPFEGYAELTVDPDQTRRDYWDMTAKNMAILDYDMCGIYSHPNLTGGKWTSADRNLTNTYISSMPGLKSIISGMHRTGYTGADGNEMINNNVSVHHTLTFWHTPVLAINNAATEKEAIDFLENEIKTYGAGGNFIQAMFLSWTYGPSRLKKLIDRLEPHGYEFVTLNEFNYLYRVSIGNISEPTSVNLIDKNDIIKIYPNPTKNQLTITGTRSQLRDISIYDLSGRDFRKYAQVTNVKETCKQIDISRFPNGIYTIKNIKIVKN